MVEAYDVHGMQWKCVCRRFWGENLN